jgi:hypothetical protein
MAKALNAPDDAHYAKLGDFQPLRVTQWWARFWPREIVYNLGEAIAAVARCGLKGNIVRDLRKAAWMLNDAADLMEKKLKSIEF